MKRQDIHNSDVPALCRNCEVRHRGLCGVLEPDELLELSRHTRVVRQPAGSELVASEAEITSYANVMRGVVKLSKMLEDGRQQLVGLQFAPDFLGRPHATRSDVTAEAASDVELCRIPRPALERLIADNPRLERRLMEQTLRELDEARDWMMTLGRKTASEKVASFLVLLATHGDPLGVRDGPRHLTLPLSRADIADFLGLTIETVSRQLTVLRKDGLIEISDVRDIIIPDLARLKARTGDVASLT